MEQKGIKFYRAALHNFKNIKVKTVEIEGRNLAIIGGNDKGKSSFIQVLKSCASSKFAPSKPIMEGEERSETAVLVKGFDVNGAEVEYLIEFYYTPGNQSGRLVMFDKDGNKVDKPTRKMLDQIFGDISFSIDAFLKKSAKEQAKDLKELTGRAGEIDAIDESIKKEMEQRLYLEKSAKEKEALLKNHGYTPEQVELYSTPIPLPPLEKQLADLAPAIEKFTKAEGLLKEARESVVRIDEKIKEKEETLVDNDKRAKQISLEIERLQEEARNLDRHTEECKEVINLAKKDRVAVEERIAKGEQWFKDNEKPDTKKITDALSNAKIHNEHHTILMAYVERQRELIKAKEEAEKHTANVESLRKKKMDIIASSNLPVPGLSFDDEGVYLNNLPFDANQINTATRLAVGEEIQMAKNGGLKCIFIEEGSLYDRDSLIRLIGKAKERNYQLICEFVKFDGGEMEVKWLEDFLNIEA